MGNLSDTFKTYVDEFRQGEHVLGDMLSHPDPDRGTVHTPAEIVQQPLLWRHTARLMREHAGNGLRRFLENAGMYDESCRPNVMLTGAGTSDYVGLSIADPLRKHFRTSVVNWPTTRITARPDVFFVPDQRYLVIHFARSGNSPESRAVLEKGLQAENVSVRHVVITCNEDGALARIARKHPDEVYLVVLHEACNDKGLAMTSSFSSMVVAGLALAHLEDMDGFQDLVERMAQAAEHVLSELTDTIWELATPTLKRVFFLGSSDLLGSATESALKVQELTAGRIMARGEDTLAFRHGPISAVDSNSLVCFYLSAYPYTRRYELDVVQQYQEAFQQLGARIVLFGAEAPQLEAEDGITFLPYDPEGRWDVPGLRQAAVATLLGQLLGVFLAYRGGSNVDDPSSEKAVYSRTVQGVHIYDGDGLLDGT